jgi:hypothetical protein
MSCSAACNTGSSGRCARPPAARWDRASCSISRPAPRNSLCRSERPASRFLQYWRGSSAMELCAGSTHQQSRLQILSASRASLRRAARSIGVRKRFAGSLSTPALTWAHMRPCQPIARRSFSALRKPRLALPPPSTLRSKIRASHCDPPKRHTQLQCPLPADTAGVRFGCAP